MTTAELTPTTLRERYWVKHAEARTEEVKLWMGLPSTYDKAGSRDSSWGYPDTAGGAGIRSAHAAFLAFPELRVDDDGVRPYEFAAWVMRGI